ncbi:hypothetical protein GRQ65_13305 [Nocardioides sp. YIM 123512]|uniref:Ceramidase n=1 Tax=Nocardioides flavescens TaxID=2691959 RepID=A0A6L7EXD8_9ACTN|nr:hypothetical protein [Nocardioides flavescens]
MRLTAGAAVVSTAALTAAVAGGWLGADIGAGAQFCEAAHAHVRQPVNSLTNAGFVVAGLAVAVRTRRGALGTGALGRWPALATAYAVLVVLLGPGSAALHATGTALGGGIDVLSMYAVAAFALGFAVLRRSAGGPATMAVTAVAALGVQVAADVGGWSAPVVHTAGNLAFGAVLLAAVVVEARTRTDRDRLWLAAALSSLVAAFAIWTTGSTGSAWCFPDSVYQGHGVWHLLCALAAWCLFRLWASERSAVSSPRVSAPPSRDVAALA